METKMRADEVLADAVATGDVAGVVAVAGGRDGIVYEGAFGRREIGGGPGMTLDTVFWIASMSKAVTTVAAMQQVERGAVSLDEPLPELEGAQVLEGFDEAGAPRVRPPRRPITLRHLLTHTAGFTYDIWNADMGRYMAHHGIPGIIECRNVTLNTPLVADPGERWEYGISIDWAGKVVERLSGQSLEDYLREHVFGPLGMRDTGFVIGPDQRRRLASMHARNADGTLQAIEFEVPQEPEFYMGGGGLYGTGPDYLAFLRMLDGGGDLDGVRVLTPETVADMMRNHIGDLEVVELKTAIPASSNDAEFFPGMVKRWGLGFMINTEGASTGRAAHSMAWAGLANTYYWLDPSRHLAGVLLTQVLPFADEQVLRLFDRFETAVYGQGA
ncbi:MAG TPA: serine hydrolase domain-containing protein [Terriglobales bacterium]|nr:serine hydrolase domain-containing protein [Terriglobales bacterium]